MSLTTFFTKFWRAPRSRFVLVVAILFGLLTIVSASLAVDITAITAQWQSPVGSSGAPTCVNTDNASSTVTVLYGDNDVNFSSCPPPSQQSGFGFTSGATGAFTDGEPFLLGELTHYNHQVFASSLLTGADLSFSFASTAPVMPAIDIAVALDETANNLATCPYGDAAPCADRMTITPATVQFVDGGSNYQLEVLGLIPDTGSGCTYNQADLRLSFISEEDSDNSSCVYARVMPIGDAEMLITKSANVTVLEPGSLVDYQIDYTCASTTENCEGVQLTDYLPAELIYVGSTGSIHTITATGSYSASSNTVLFDFVDPLPAGSTGYVRVRARVRDDGTLVDGQTITNTATATQTNGPTSSGSISLPVQTISNWEVQKTGDSTAYVSTEPPITDMHYTVQICPNGSNVNLLGAQMVDQLPAGAVFVSASGGGVYDGGTNTITWSLGDLAASAGCASETVVVRFPNPPFSAAQTVTNSVTGTGTIPGVGPFTGTADFPNTLQNFLPLPSVAMNKATSRADYTVGASVDYYLTPSNTGNSPLYNLSMTDNLPDAIKVTQVRIGASAYPVTLEYAVNGSSTYTTWPGSPFTTNPTLPVSALGLPNGTWITSIIWHFNPGAATPPGWSLTSPAVITGTITTPDRLGQPVNVGDTINNNATLHWEYLPGGTGTCASPNAQCGSQLDGASIDVVVLPVPVFNKSSGGGVSQQQRFIVGQDVGYFNLNVNNNTGIAVDNFILTDEIPTAFNVTSINVGNASGTVGVRYQVNNSGTWVTLPGSPFAANATVSTPVSGISDLEFSYGTIPGSFTTSSRINGTTLATGWDGTPVHDGDNMVNNARMDWTYLGSPNNRTASTSDPIRNPTVTPSASKSVTTSGPYIPTSAVSYRLTFGAAGNSPSNVMNSPVVADLLPANVNFVSYSFNANGTALTGPAFEQIANYNGSGRTLLRWTFGGSLNRGQTASIDLNTTLSAGTSSGNLENSFIVTVSDMPVNGGTQDVDDLDGDGQTIDTVITASTSIPVDQLVGLDSQKRVKGELDSAYSVYPAYGETVPNGLVAYRLSIINRGNVPMNNVRVIDILPFVGDTGVQDTRPRNSAWRPILTSPVTPQAGVTIYYSTATNPCRPEILSTGPAGCTAPNWSASPPANLDSVRSLRFDFAGTLAPGQTFTFNWSMRAPVSGPTDGQVAWNSFAFTSSNALTGVPLRPAEPNKVGIIYRTAAQTALIDLEKYTNNEDADLAPGPQIPTTGTVTWKYTVTNTGSTRLANITVIDDQEGAITCPPGILEVGASIDCTWTGTPIEGQYANNATVTGTAVDGAGDPIDGDPLTPGTQLIQPTDTDPSHYYGYDPALARLGDYTWIDLDNNGQQDGGEPPLGGVTVRLLDNVGNPVDDPTQAGTQDYVTTTNASGFYNFVNLTAGDYIVQFDTPSAYTLTTADSGSDATDSDANPTTGRTGIYHLNAGEYDATVDAGFIARASLGDRVWIDINGNGVQDASETATPTIIQGMQVELYDAGNNLVATTYTDEVGYYLFNDLNPGTYYVQFPTPPTGYLWTTPDAGGDDAADSDVAVTTYRTPNTTLSAGENDPTWDAGLVAVANIGNYVWADNNFNGQQDGGELGVSGVTVRLLNGSGTQATDDNGTLIPDQVTASNGLYAFTNLRPGQYEVQFLTLPAGYIFTDQNTGSDALDSDANTSTGRTQVTTLDAGETDNTWDAGLIKLASLGDKVWLDTDGDGTQDSGENGVAGAMVTLRNANTLAAITTDALGSTISTITTSATGLYSFTNLDPRIPYVVEFGRPANYVFSPANQGGDTTDSDAVPAAALPTGIGRTGTYNLTAGENNTTVDAGLVQPAAIGNFIWYDTNNDGLQTAGELGVSGVTVRLLNSVGNQATDEQGNLIADLVTGSDGLYHFTNLVPGTYSLAFSTLPSGYTFAKRDAGADTLDSDPNRFTGRTVTTALSPNEDDVSWDAGVVLAAALGNFVWEDRDADGIQNQTDEPGVDGITVRLLDSSNQPIDNPNTATIGDAYTTTTSGGGFYSFVGLPPNETYRVRFVLPNGSTYLFTKPNQGADDAVDSDGTLNGNPTVNSVTTANITTLVPGGTDNDWDQGVLLPSALGNFVWRDNNDDGLQTAGEPGISGVTVRLLASDGVTTIDNPNNNGTQAYVVTTNASGIYAFTNLYPGQYVVQWDTPTGYKRSDYFVGSGTNDTTDSDMQIADGKTPVITLPYATTDNTWDAGFTPLASLGDFVWRDNNGNGVQDGGEPGINGVTVRLYDATNVTSGAQLATTTTVTVGGIAGSYAFTNLDPDLDYVVEFVTPAPPTGQSNYIHSLQDQGSDVADSDADATTGLTDTIALDPGENDITIDAGFTPLAQLGDTVWYDHNGNGIQDGGAETGVNLVTVHLYDAGDLTTPIATTQTDANGFYQFLDLYPGTYVVSFELPSGYIFTRQDVSGGTDATDSDANPLGANQGFTGSYLLNYNDSNQTVDAGIVQPARLGDLVWYDANNDGVQDGAEAGVSGVTVHLLAADGVTTVDDPNQAGTQDYVVTTDSFGSYAFENLYPGTYTVKFDLPSSDYVIAKHNQGGDDALDSDADRITGVTGPYTLAEGDSNITVDAGILLRGAKLGDFVWIDLNNNGQQDSGEVGLNGVTVTLLNSAGGTDIDPITPGNQTLSIVTTNNPSTSEPGWYQFTGLVPDNYIVAVTLPGGYQFSPKDNVADNTADSDVSTTTGRTDLITVAEDGDDQTWDAGLVPLASIGNYVWIDQNNDGIQDAGELPLSGVTVHLLAADGTTTVDNPNLAGSQPYVATTDSSGFYQFTNLPPSMSYVVQFDPVAHYQRSPVDANSNANDTTDSDADPTTGKSAATNLDPNEYDDSIDAGYVPLAQLGDFVWLDADYDGVQDGGETGIDGVTVDLYDDANHLLGSTTTAGGGLYQFIDLVKGNYVVKFTPLTGYALTLQDSTTDAADSDAERAGSSLGFTGVYAIDWGDSNQTIDAGMFQYAQLGNFVWEDLNDNGRQDGGEPGVNGVTVHLLDGSGNPVDDPNQAGTQDYVVTTANDGSNDGAYQFTGLFPGVYEVSFDLPSAYNAFARVDAAAATDATDSDADRSTGTTGTYTLIAGQTDDTVDAGLLKPASLGDFVWNDADGNGIQAADELGVAGVIAHLLDGSGNPVDDPNQVGTQDYVVTTASDGAYQFTNLVPGDYQVSFDLPTGTIFTRPDQGADDAADSDADRFTGTTIVTTLVSGENDLTWDAGVLLPAALGNYVWLDANDNGVQDAVESGVNGVTVHLLDGSGNPVDDPNQAGTQNYVVTTANDGANDGAYHFTGLFPGAYQVSFDLPSSDTIFARQDQGADDATDSDADRTTGETGNYTLVAGQTDNTVDAGMMQRASLGDFVWNDADGNGIQDAGELGVAGVTVHLLDGSGSPVDDPNQIGTQDYVVTTASDGTYLFENLIPGDYQVSFDLPTGYIFTRPDQGADAADSDADRFTGATIVTTLVSGEDDLTWDAGVLQPAALGNYVWLDANDDGVQDAGESGINGVTVHLLDGSGNPVDDPNQSGTQDYVVTTANDGSNDGAYHFTGLFPGVYQVGFDLPSNDYVFARQDQGADAADSDADRTTGTTGSYTLVAGQTDNTVDAGMMQFASLGDFVWNDADGNGIQAAGELGVDGVTVHLLDDSGNPVDDPNQSGTQDYVVTTAGGGLYQFTNLIPGDYQVKFYLPTGYIFTRPDQGADAADSDADRFTGATIVTALVSGENDLTWDVGVLQPAALGNYVWLDVNDNGVQDGSESGINGVTVHLLDSSSSPVDDPNQAGTQNYVVTTANDGTNDGAYQFTGLFPGVYQVSFDLPSSDYVFARQDQGADDAADSDADRSTGTTGNYTLIAGQTDNTVDAGMMLRASLGDRVWRDMNDDGLQDGGEIGISGVTVNLLDEGGAQIDTTTTDGTGHYLFDNLVPGVYSLEFVLPSNQYEFSDQDQGADDAADSDADFTSGATVQTHLLSGEDDLTWDAGLVPLASIGDRVWIDLNNNGVQDGGEANYPGATVNLLDAGGSVIDTTTTDASGSYLFDLLSPGDYGIQVILPAHYQFSPQNDTTHGGTLATDSDVDFTTGTTATTTLLPDEHDLTWDAGLVPLVSIGNYVWIDMNNDGVQDATESGFPGITVNLLDAGGSVIDTMTTDASGNYLFSDLPPGNYGVEVMLPYNYQFSPQDAGGNDQTDSDVNFATGRTITFTVLPGVDDDTRDAGLVPLVSIGDFVWRDNNGDGVQDAGEPGIPGIIVNLYNDHALVATTTTDANGNYLFDLLPPGRYLIEVIAPPNYIHSPKDVGGDDTVDSDVDPTTERTPFTTLDPDEDDMTWDAGLAPLATIGDRVWNDRNQNGVQDTTNEPGMGGVRVSLLNGTGGFLQSTTTDAYGLYLFENLLPGDYIIQVAPPDGYGFTPADQGGDDDIDSDVNTTSGRTIATHLDYGEIDLTWDAGVQLLPNGMGMIGDTVWVDINRNGVQDAGEQGIPNVTVILTLPGGSTITTVTDGSGKYLFTDLFAGDYTVTVDLTTLPPGLTQTYDLDGTLDSQTGVTLAQGEIFLAADFGYAPRFSTIAPTFAPTGSTTWQSIPACPRACVDWQLYHTNQTGDWEIFRLGDLTDRPSISTNLSQGEGADDMSPTRSPNADWIVFSSNRDGNWELYLASTDGDSSKLRRLTYNSVAIDTDPVWGPNNYVVYESTRDGNWELYLLDLITGAERRLTNDPASDLNAYWSTDGTKLIFQSNRSGLWQIYQLDLATNVVTRLSDGSANDVDAVYSSDSSRIAFRSYRDGDGRQSTLYLMDADGGNLQRISDVNGDATDQVWSTDDSLIAYQSDLDGDLDIYVYQVNTGVTRKLTNNDIRDYAPTWLCDSTTVIFTSDASGNPDIYSADAQPISAPAIDVTTDAQQLTTDPADDIYPESAPVEENASREGRLPGVNLGDQTDYLNPDVSVTVVDPSLDSGSAWEPINSCPTVCPAWTLYQSDRTGDQEVFRMNSEGGSDLNLSTGISASDRGPTRSPDARWVAFTSDRDGNQELYLVGADGAGLRRITDNAAADTNPNWSPNSQYIAYESNRSGSWDIYVLDVQTGVTVQVTRGQGDNRNPDWSSAGGSLVFQSNRDGHWQLYRYDLVSGTTQRLVNLPQEATNPVYANGGGQIVFRVLESDGHSVLYLVGQDGSDPHAISDPTGNAGNPQWYSDDTLIAYQSDLDGDLDVYVYDLRTETTRQLTDNQVADYAPTWTCAVPDVIFTSQVDGNDDIFRASALEITDPPLDVTAQAQQLTNNPASDNYPLGAPNKGDDTE